MLTECLEELSTIKVSGLVAFLVIIAICTAGTLWFACWYDKKHGIDQ
ncbi:hypothetical protein [Vibrio tapetis]|uniref:Uncharacterized protein n=1 Tax=Vibrio tapetis subsp. tapetis TaxID=1671868 RepID=A0A2N8Z8D9_9VIBR|nr:hypothetical protein [Vibrio tapetis]SON48160.1 protein of unknown function [Vibrio tapetis subsp. tapetis]